MAAEKKVFSSNSPRGQARYLLEVTRLTVDSWMPISSATIFSVIGFRWEMPCSMKPRCCSTMTAATLRIVLARWSRLFTSQLAACRRSVR